MSKYSNVIDRYSCSWFQEGAKIAPSSIPHLITQLRFFYYIAGRLVVKIRPSSQVILQFFELFYL